MAEETTQAATETQSEQVTLTNESDKLRSLVFGDVQQAATQEPQQQDAVQEQASQTQEPTKEADNVFDETTYLKDFGWENKETALNELKTLREKSKETSGWQWKNEDSKKVAEYINDNKIVELYRHLDTQMKVDRLATADLSNKDIAAELVKFGIQNSNPSLTQNEVDFLYNKKFSIPKEPIQKDTELEDEFQARHGDWQEHKRNVEMELSIEAKMAQPKLAQMKSELVLPNIQKENQQQTQQQPTQEDLVAIKQEQDSFMQFATQIVDKFNGFSATVKDKDVNYSVAYTPSKEEKATLNGVFQKFAESGYNANVIFADRWLTQDGKINVDQMTKDVSNILTGEAAYNKIATDSASKRLEAFLKDKKNINVAETRTQGTFSINGTDKSTSQRLQEAAFG